MKNGIISHIEIYVSNLDKSKEFWDWLLCELGYAKFQSWDKGFSWKLDDTYLVFVQTLEKYNHIKYHRCNTGLNHLAFMADSPKSVDKLTEKLKLKNIQILYSDKHPFAGGNGTYSVYFEDPDRIKVEYVYKKSKDS